MNGRRRIKLRVRNANKRVRNLKKQETLNLSSSGNSFKNAEANIKQSNQSNKAKEMLYGAGKWVKSNPGKTIGYGVLGAVGADMLWRGGNEFIRLPIIYKDPENAQQFEAGMGASNVVEVVKRFGDINKKLVRKRIRRVFSLGYLSGDFNSEKLACEMLTKWSKEEENEEIFKHIAKVVDYHYGLANLYVTYEEANGVDWEKQNINDWSDEQKFDWLHKVCKQVIDVALFFQSKGFYHGDLHCLNYNISGDKENPFVNVFDFGRFYKVKEKGKNKPEQSPGWDLNQILRGFIALAIRIFGVIIPNMFGVKQITYGKEAQDTALVLLMYDKNFIDSLKYGTLYQDKFFKEVIDMFVKNREQLDIVLNFANLKIPTKDDLSSKAFRGQLLKLGELLQ